jgi:hypothetical protein
LLPHRDSQNILDDYRRKLFAAGFMGAYSFPAAAPLALLSGPLSKGELKKIASEIRDSTLKNEGKITASGIGLVRCPENTPFGGSTFYGPLLDFSAEGLSGLANEKAFYIFPKLILCAAITSVSATKTADTDAISDIKTSPIAPKDEQLPAEFPELSFRAAMVSNLAISPLKSGAVPYSQKWSMGPGCWLPRYKS